jgi:mycothiol system anti-sigma-R factor
MSPCADVIALLEVYLDDETSPDTNALVQQHLDRCPSCAARLQAARRLRADMRSALREDRAPAALRARVGAAIAPERPRLAAFIRSWLVPAAATVLVAWIVLPWRSPEPGIDRAMAVSEHVACALREAVPTRAASYYGAQAAMPLLPDDGGRIRILDAHTCGQHADYLHVVLEEAGAKASVLIVRAPEGGEHVSRPERSGDFEVSEV